MILCDRRERRTSIKSNNFQHFDSESDSLQKNKILFQSYSLRCESYQCFFCLENVNLMKKNRRYDFAN